MEKIKKIFENIKLKWLRETSLTIIIILVIVAVFLGINIGVEKLNLTDIDLTSEKLYTLTEESKAQIAKIPEEEEIEIYLFDYEENSSIVDLVKQYMKVHEKIKMELTTVSDRKDLATEYGIYEGYNSILIKSGEKYKMYYGDDLYTYDYNTGETIDIAEQRLTNGFISVSSIGKTTPIYALTGHEEYSTSMYLYTFLTYAELEGYEFKNLDLLVEEKVPDDCTALVIASPHKDFTELETNKIKDYINAGGSILWMNDTMSIKEDAPNIKSILDLYGVTLHQDGYMIEQDTTRMVAQIPYYVMPVTEYSEITSKLPSNSNVILFNPSKLTFENDDKLEELGVTKTDLLSTSSEAFYRTDMSISDTTPSEGEEVGKQVVGATLEKSIDDDTTSKLVIYANNIFGTDYPVTIGSQSVSAVYLGNNLNLLINSISYLAEIEDQITIKKTIETVSYTPTETQHIVVMIIIFAVPVIVVILGIVVWQLRRRKK